MRFIRNLLFHSPWLYFFVRLVLGGLFVIAGGAKLIDPRAFARMVSAYGLLPEGLLVPVAIGLPAIELLAGAGLLFNIRGSLKVICALLCFFLFVIGYAIWKNLDVDCGCFSQLEIKARNSLYIAFLRDLGLITASFYLLLYQRIRDRLCAMEYLDKNEIKERT